MAAVMLARPEAQLPTDVYIGFKECSSTVHSLTYPIEKLVETVGTGVTVLEGMILEGLRYSPCYHGCH
jgi:hypothetical protein